MEFDEFLLRSFFFDEFWTRIFDKFSFPVDSRTNFVI